MKIVDASVAIKWFADEAGADEAARTLADDLVAPSLILGEVANGLWKKWRLHEVSREQSLVAVANLPDMLTELYPLTALADRAVQLSFEYDHPVYDCFYLALAERLQIEIVTADVRMVNKFASTQFACWLQPLVYAH